MKLKMFKVLNGEAKYVNSIIQKIHRKKSGNICFMRQRLRVFFNNQVVFIYLCIHIHTYTHISETTIIKEKRVSP